MKTDRLFYSTAASIFVLLMMIGFHPFYAHGTGFAGRRIEPVILPLVVVHGVAIAAWFALFLTQSVLISVRSRKLHMKLGWSAIVVGLTIAWTGSLVAIRSVQLSREIPFFGMEYPRFLLVMLTEMACFTLFLSAGLLTRKKPKIHRAMMLMASLSILPGATVRIPFLISIFGASGWVGLFGAVFCVGAVLLMIRCAMTRTVDRWFAGAYALWVAAFIASTSLAMTETWDRLAIRILAL
jgi:hypothetical protein